MILRLKKYSFIFMTALLLTNLFTGVVQAQDCQENKVYYNEADGDDVNGDGKSDDTAFETKAKAIEAASSCPGPTVSFYKNGVFEEQLPITQIIAEASGFPIAETLWLGGLLLIALILIGIAFLLRRKPMVTAS